LEGPDFLNLLSIFASAFLSFSAPENVRIDPGGSIADRMQQIERIEKSGTLFRIDGMCISACTMYLGLKSVCVAPRTVLGFHSSYTQSPLGRPEPSKYGNAVVMSYYPEKIRKWVQEKKVFDSLDLTPMTAEEAWDLGIPKCD